MKRLVLVGLLLVVVACASAPPKPSPVIRYLRRPPRVLPRQAPIQWTEVAPLPMSIPNGTAVVAGAERGEYSAVSGGPEGFGRSLR